MNNRGMTFFEIIAVIVVLTVLISAVVIAFSKTLTARSIEGEAENLAALIRAAQTSAKETESAQIILLTETSATWIRLPTLAEVKQEIETVRKQVFKNDVKIAEIELKGSSIEVPAEPVANIGIIIEENGQADSSTIVLAKGEERTTVSAGGSIVTSRGGSLGTLEGDIVIPTNVGIHSNDEVLMLQTEPLQARGWQVINVNNADRVKEVKLRIKLDERLPASAHVHIYVFPGWYENKPIVHGVTEEQTMLYRESTDNCLSFFDNPSISGYARKLNSDPIADVEVKVNTLPTLASTLTNESGFYEFNPLPNGYYWLAVDRFQTIREVLYEFYPFDGYDISNVENGAQKNFLGARRASFNISGVVRNKQTNEGMAGVKIRIMRQASPFITTGGAFEDYTTENGSYAHADLSADHYYMIIPESQGCVFEPASVMSLFLDENKTVNFDATVTKTSFETSQPPLGTWNYNEGVLKHNAFVRQVPIWSEPRGYYVYKDKIKIFSPTIKYPNTTQNFSMIKNISSPQLLSMTTINKPVNTLNPGGFSDFPTKEATRASGLNEVGVWNNGYIYSHLAHQIMHTEKSNEEEIKPSEWTEWLSLPISSLPSQTKLLRIAIALYHQTPNGEELFNLAPTNSSTHPNDSMIAIQPNMLDYQTDPIIIYHPWHNWGADPFWLSLYGYALNAVTPPLRPYGVNVLAATGPVTGENYRNSGGHYKEFWYGPLYLDWDLILGKESLYWLTSWVTSVFEINSMRWRFNQDAGEWLQAPYNQDVDTYGNTALASPPHYWLKNFAYLSYWYLFQNAIYSEQVPGLSLQDASLPKRIQQPLNLLTSPINNYGGLALFERTDPTLYSTPWESSSLSIPFGNLLYPLWLPNLPTIFGQSKITTASDLYSSFYYLQERINHIMLDTALWTFSSSETTYQQKSTAYYNIIFSTTTYRPNSPTFGNFERFCFTGSETLSSWWNWYQTIPWAKGVAFPRKTGPLPTNMSERAGWEKPVITSSSYWNYFTSPLIFKNDPINSYNATQVVNAAHTIFMSTSHYPLGIIQIVIKK